MDGGQGDKPYEEACKDAGLNTVKEQLDMADRVCVFWIMNGDNKLNNKTFCILEEARQGAGRRRFKEKDIRRTVAGQCKDVRKRISASRTQDPWNDLSDSVKQAKKPRAFRRAYRKVKNLV